MRNGRYQPATELNSSGCTFLKAVFPEKIEVPRFVSIFILMVYVATLSSCYGGNERGSYFLYGLQWGMTWKEVVEVLKVEELEESDSGSGVKVAEAPFFLAGVSGKLKITFKKRLFGYSALKAVRYEAKIKGPGIRGESFNVLLYEMKLLLGDPTKIDGTPEEADEECSGKECDVNTKDVKKIKTAEPYSALWRHEDGDVIVEVNPSAKKFILRAEAKTSNPKLAWLK